MKQLKQGTSVPLTNGTNAVVKKLLGEGGQGSVYLASINGKDYALKIYAKKPSLLFRKNMAENIRKGAPTKHFLWMKWLVDTPKMFGYVMDVRPKEYEDFSKFLIARTRFASWSAMINAALQISYAFRALHRLGLSYQDLNDGNFFFNPKTGDVLICDNDNVCPADTNLGIKGKCRYMAPEVVLGKSNPNNLSDYFSLGVVLFMLLFNNHPFDGAKVASVPCLNDAIEKEVYGKHPVFIYDRTDKSNRPIMGVHKNVMMRWDIFPKFIQDTFIEEFSKEVLTNPNRRKSDNEWIKLFTLLRNQIITCTCGCETFIDVEQSYSKCFNCGKKIQQPLILHVGKQSIALLPGICLYECLTEGKEDGLFEATGEVVRNKQNPSLWGISNHSKTTWTCTLPDGRTMEVPTGKGLPIFKNVQIKFTDKITGNIN